MTSNPINTVSAPPSRSLAMLVPGQESHRVTTPGRSRDRGAKGQGRGPLPYLKFRALQHQAQWGLQVLPVRARNHTCILPYPSSRWVSPQDSLVPLVHGSTHTLNPGQQCASPLKIPFPT